LSWELASQKLQSNYTGIIAAIGRNDFSGLTRVLETDQCLSAVYSPLKILGESFRRVFWKILAQSNSVLPIAQAHMALSMWQRTTCVHIQGVPGSGKTTLMAMLAIVNCVQADCCILWTAVNVNAVKEGASTLDSLLCDAPAAVRFLFVRFLGKKHVPVSSIDVPFMQRRHIIGNHLQQKAGLTT
jgi:hypothetical protein